MTPHHHHLFYLTFNSKKKIMMEFLLPLLTAIFIVSTSKVSAIDCSPPDGFNLADEKRLRQFVEQADLVVVGTLLDLNRKMTQFELIGEDQAAAFGREGRVLIRRVFKGQRFLSTRFNELSTTARIQSKIPTIILGSDAEGILQVRGNNLQPYEEDDSSTAGPTASSLAKSMRRTNSNNNNGNADELVAYLREGMLNVHGFHSPAICNSAAERFDTRIFLLKQLPERAANKNRQSSSVASNNNSSFRWRLLIAPISLNWRTIETIESAIPQQKFQQKSLNNIQPRTTLTTRVWSYGVTSSPITLLPSITPVRTMAPTKTTTITTKRPLITCADFRCTGPGEICVMVQGLPKCTCPTSCPAVPVVNTDSLGALVVDQPTIVCGTDGKTYESMCHLAKAQCETKSRTLRLKHTGSCDVPDPCLTTNCTFGAICERSLDGLTSRCICPRNCPPSASTTICGSDGRDYGSLCLLRKTACESMRDVQPARLGKCNPCDGVICPIPGQQCIVEPTSHQPRCACVDTCSKLPYTPVCATNGKTYSNQCYLQLEACRLNMTLAVFQPDVLSCRQTGIPCQPTTCSGPGEECIVSGRNGKPSCVCPFTEAAALPGHQQKQRRYNHQQRRSVTTTAELIVAPPSFCPKTNDQVCGDDNVTYASDCELRRTACLRRRPVGIRFYGICDDAILCSSIRCHFGAKCAIFRQTIDRQQIDLDIPGSSLSTKLLSVSPVVTCRCPESHCSYSYAPVCGSDGKTYVNKCILDAESCRLQKTITVFHKGQCGGCEDLTCPFYANCTIDFEGQPQCVCPTNCPQAEAVVCGSDNRTYINYCEMTVAACRLNMNISLVHVGYCDQCRSIVCPPGRICVYGRCVCPSSCVDIDAPVCGSDGRTYRTECHLQTTACENNRNISVIYRGPCTASAITAPKLQPSDPSYVEPACSPLVCRFGGNCELDLADGRVKCLCSNFTCLEIRDPVCASDGKLYGNLCEMHKVSCQLQKLLTKVPLSECQNLEPLPCNGRHAPLTDAFGVEYDCLESSSPTSSTTCPAKSFCHRGPTFAVCCPEESMREILALSTSRASNRRPTPSPPLGGFAASPTTGFKRKFLSYRALAGDDDDNKQYKTRHRKHVYYHQGVSSVKTMCESTDYGCCRDGASVAHGYQGEGCPEWCRCDPIGSFGSLCSLPTGQCMCRPGVMGLKCDQCMRGFHSFSPSNHPRGCITCDCDPRGTEPNATNDCNVATGQCLCRPIATGRRCNRCIAVGQVLTNGGHCVSPSVTLTEDDPDQNGIVSCNGVICQFGAVCAKSPTTGYETCSCEALQCSNQLRPVCASDRRSYANKCHMRLYGCRSGRRLFVHSFGYCPESEQKATFAEDTMMTATENQDGEADTVLLPNGQTGPLSACDQRLNFRCLHGGTCYIDENNSARCLCPIGRIGTYCEMADQSRETTTTESPLPTSISTFFQPSQNQFSETPSATSSMMSDSRYFVPSFAPRSYIKLKRPRDVSTNLTLELEVRAMKPSGTVLYIGQGEPNRPPSASRQSDFIAIVLRDGFVEFRFDVGAGMMAIRSQRSVTLKQFHVVVAHWSTVEGSAYLQLDDAKWQMATATVPGLVAKKSAENHTLLLTLPVVLGYVKGADQRSSVLNDRFGGLRNGFVGCIQSLRISNSIGHSKIYSLVSTSKDVLFGRDIDECGRTGPCVDSPCLNRGTCVATNNKTATSGYFCACPPGYSGSRCEITAKCEVNRCRNGGTCQLVAGSYPVCACPPYFTGPNCQIEKGNATFIPLLTGRSFIERPPIGELAIQFRIEIWFLATQPHGVLLLAASQRYGRGDFITINMADGYVQAHVRHASWTQQILSEERIPLNVWTKLVVLRQKRDELILSINGRRSRTQLGRFVVKNGDENGVGLNVKTKQAVKAAKAAFIRTRQQQQPLGLVNSGLIAVAPASDQAGTLPTTPLKLPLPYFIGGFRHFYDVPAESNVLHPFEGAIQKVSIDDVDLTEILAGSLAIGGDIRPFAGPPCTGNPCLHGGHCQPILADFRCVCPANYVGDLCEFDRKDLNTLVQDGGQDALAVRFNGSTILRFYNAIKRKERQQETNKIRLRMRTLARDGTLALIRKSNTASSDFLIAALRDGFLEVAVNLGSGQPTALRSNRRVNDGAWHTILLNRQKRLISLLIDSEPEIAAFAPDGTVQLNSNGYLVIGGMDSRVKGLPIAYSSPFVGCMTGLEVDDADLELYSGRRGSARHPLSLCSAGDDPLQLRNANS